MKEKFNKSKKSNNKRKIVFLVVCFLILFILVVGVVKYFNDKIDVNNKKILQDLVDDNKKICFEKECFYILDYSIKEKIVYLMLDKNIDIDDVYIKKNNSIDLTRDDVDGYLEFYKNKLNDLGVDVLDVLIPTDKHLEKNGCTFKQNSSNIYTCSDNKSWIYSTSYYYEGDVSGVMVNIKELNTHFIFPFDMDDRELDDMYGKDSVMKIGIRPVIKVSIGNVKNRVIE